MQKINVSQPEKHKDKLLALVIGNIATGKTTFINSLKKRENRTIIINDNYPDVNNSDMSNLLLPIF